MNSIDKNYFDAKHKERSESADVFERPANRGIWRSIVEKYTDQAHFIYELIQNADDAGATSARFMLEENRLIFAHNGTRHFSISNPDTEEADAENGALGDINAITGIAFSNKPEQQNKIGKFGVGFKAVFQYTATPHIYDPEFRFRIDRYIVPSLLENDFPGRRSEETLFVFPFDHRNRTPKETYADIAGKLKALSQPILFLSNLRDIYFEIGDTIGLYGKSIDESFEYDDGTIAEKICVSRNYGDDIISQNLWLFTRFDNGLKYSVGYLLNSENQLMPMSSPAFCFFPTKETTGLNFIIHAPFLLTDSREGILAGEAHNIRLIDLLAKLAGSTLLYLRDIGEKKGLRLIDDNIFSLIPINEGAFCELDDISSISFKPFYTEIQNIFKTERIIPTRQGYTITANAYWASVPFLTDLFTDEQLSEICGKSNASWVFVSLGRDEILRNNKPLFSYIESITFTGLTEQHLVKGRYTSSYYSKTKDIEGITAQFIEHQPLEWLFRFYKWLSETSTRTDFARTTPVFLDQDRKAASAYDENDHMLLFLPSTDMPNCRTVHEELLNNIDARALIEKLRITTPSIRDEIYNTIIPLYRSNDENIDIDAHFRLFYKYYQQCPQGEIDEFIEEIRDCDFITYTSVADPKMYRGKADDLYVPTDELREYFETTPDTVFVALDEYISMLGSTEEKNIISFLVELGAKTEPAVYEDNSGGYYNKTVEYYVDGLKELIEKVVSEKSHMLSERLWKYLCEFLHKDTFSYRIQRRTIGSRPDGRYNWRYTYETSSTLQMLRDLPWLVSNNDEFVCAKNIQCSLLSSIYDMSIVGADKLVELLEFQTPIVSVEEDNSNLTDLQREKVEFADRIRESGITEADFAELLRIKEEREAREARKRDAGSVESDNEIIIEGVIEEDADEIDGGDAPASTAPRKLHQTTSKVARDILKRTHSIPTVHTDSSEDESVDVDADEFTPTPIDYSRKTELAKEKAAREIDKIAYLEELQQRALDSERYTYGWFKALLELETLNSNANALDSKEVSISFARVEREPGTQRTLVLKQPSRYIPQFMEDLADIPLVLHFGDQTKTLAIEVANVKSYTLRVKLKSHVDISDIDFSKVTEARIDAKSPVFLLEELRKQLNALGEENEYEDSFNMQENLCENIEFVFGPPGTGKTTHLARNVIVPLMRGAESPKVLVLTPTNKAADVLARRIMDVMGEDFSYNDWLVRFGGTGDEIIEDSQIFRDKSFDIRTLRKNVTITTIARFPYDFFMPQGYRVFLNGIKWDYIIIDEASMIPLVNMIYPLYKKTPKKFIIAGDPFQIEPITSVDLWRNENIYTMVKLDSFTEPHTIPHDYKVELLTTQYRSIPSVGSIFSQFAYGGILKHYRNEASRKPLNIDLKVEPLNLIKFPVSKYESIYRCKRLQHSSSYQVYSALFTFEFAHYFAEKIASSNPNETFRIGIIAPYCAQADLIEKLICSKDIPSVVDIQVGTIHGFQGDECDAIFVVLNTPPSISASPEMFLNKRNIINVSISRAKDYLFLIMPDDDTDNIHNLRLVKRVERLIKDGGCYTEMHTPHLEGLMFGSSTYLEDNTFSTGHQSVNVYGLPEKCYEIRSEDTAVDVQIHRPVATTSHQPQVITPPKVSTSPSVQTVAFYWLDEKTRICPFDHSLMSVMPVPVYKTDGRSKKLNMLVCPNCQKKYMTKSGVPESIHLEEYCVRANPLPTKTNSTAQTPPVSPNGRAYKPGDILKGKKIIIAVGGGETVKGIVRDDTGSMISLQISNDTVVKYQISIKDRTNLIRILD